MAIMSHQLCSAPAAFRAAIAGLLLFCGALSTAGPLPDDHHFRRGGELLNRGLYLEAMGMYREIVGSSASPEHRARALLLMGNTYALYLEQYERALEQFQRILRDYAASSSAPDALFFSGTVLFESARYQKAQRLFSDYLSRYPDGKRRTSAQVWAAQAADLTTGREISRPALRQPDTPMRVLLPSRSGRVRIEARKAVVLRYEPSGRTLTPAAGALLFSAQGGRLRLNDRDLETGRVRVCAPESDLLLDGRAYRGDVTVAALATGLQVVNHVPLAQYLYGVIPLEMPAGWAAQALAAQAVAARTYALYLKGKRSDRPYDLGATTTSQVYGGRDAEQNSSSQAVAATRGQVLTHEGRLVMAYFHANSGGFTEDPKDVWGAELPYLKRVRDRFSLAGGEGSWEVLMPFQSLQARLQHAGYDVEGLADLVPSGRTASGRICTVVLRCAKGRVELSGGHFRSTIGAQDIRSTLFRVKRLEKGLLFSGRGYGHGVGMSQWGARQMAREGFDYRAILRHYYRDVRIRRLPP